MIASRTISRLSGNSAFRANAINRRLLSTEKEPLKEATKQAKEAVSDIKPTVKTESSWWTNVELWGRLGAIAGWGMSGSAIYDAQYQSPDIISMNMTTVLIVYSSLFARWAWIVKPQNLLLASCHITNVGAQLNQLRRALEYKLEQGQKEEVEKYLYTAAAGAAGGAACIMGGPAMRSKLMAANIGILSAAAAADAGPFTVHFWAPMSKWLISGASFMDLYRDTDKISIAQYSALTFTGLFFSRYSLLVTPINYTLCSVNVALFGSSAWHLGRKLNADFIEEKK
mmetsp:Transcript_12694/g.19016  ORF Transcript_12694/g.19016 Transcript_12694/m.19016 type:complete len:284 (+) Transcript_12694:134-985(+)